MIAEEKSLIENQQRELRKSEKGAGISWETRWFDKVDYLDKNGEPVKDEFTSLTNMANLSIYNAPSGTLKKSKYDHGEAKHWRFNKQKLDAEKEIKF